MSSSICHQHVQHFGNKMQVHKYTAISKWDTGEHCLDMLLFMFCFFCFLWTYIVLLLYSAHMQKLTAALFFFFPGMHMEWPILFCLRSFLHYLWRRNWVYREHPPDFNQSQIGATANVPFGAIVSSGNTSVLTSQSTEILLCFRHLPTKHNTEGADGSLHMFS